MDDSQLEIAFEMMGEKIRGNGSNKVVRCPLAPWKHPKGKDSKPSMTVKAGDPAVYRCWACGSQGTVKYLSKMFASLSGQNQSYEFVCQCEGDGTTTWGKTFKYGDYAQRVGKRARVSMSVTEELVKRWLEYVPNVAVQRGMTLKQIDRWEIGHDRDLDRLTIPIRDHVGNLIGASGRALRPDQTPKYRHYPGTEKEKVFFGERYYDFTVKRCYLVEGFFDVFAMERFGLKNVFAVMGTSVSDAQKKKLNDWVDEVIFLPDLDDGGAGIKFCQLESEKICKSRLKVAVAGVIPNPYYHPRKKPTKDWEPFDFMFDIVDGLKGKDPGDWTKDDLDLALKNICWVRATPNGVRAFGG